MTKNEAVQSIRTQMLLADTDTRKTFWKGVLVGLACGENLNIQLMKDLAEEHAGVRQREVGP